LLITEFQFTGIPSFENILGISSGICGGDVFGEDDSWWWRRRGIGRRAQGSSWSDHHVVVVVVVVIFVYNCSGVKLCSKIPLIVKTVISPLCSCIIAPAIRNGGPDDVRSHQETINIFPNKDLRV
jgi:hypothetical protein